MAAKLKAIKEVLQRNRHQPIPVLGKWLGRVVRGYFEYHAVPTNIEALSKFRYDAVYLLWRVLLRRSQRDGTTLSRITKIADAYLPKPRILHPIPRVRFAVKHPRWEPCA
jgi:hypothetical protein